ncbi:hypothetical protein B0J12DRAFT_696211 [Macrophomina phaseolina]|uniref:Uncharacterized protein n=1 Tax=Macrophomina phaseolina TaxID=35725 RepID=A0ABQ8GMJ0_9PEZI|nr:hypothetical protein B0J12DRAFT_696211 [Macrophomina phaseolina]
MRHTVRYHLRALVRRLKRRADGIKANNASRAAPMACGAPCHYHYQPHTNRSAYSLLSADDMLLDDSIELLPPPRMVPAASGRPSAALSSPSSSSRPPSHSGASTSTLDTCSPPTPRSETLSDNSSSNSAGQRRCRRRETWTKSLALDALFFLLDEEGREEEKEDRGAETKPRDALRTKRDSFMWMKFDGHGGGLAWADGARLAGVPVVM